jgi:hypothetical protein
MPDLLRRFVSACHLQRHGAVLVLIIVVAGLLELAAGVGLAYVAGFSSVRAVLGGFQWPWLILLSGSLAVSFAGYYLGYQGIFRVDGDPGSVRLSARQMHAVVAAAFCGLLAHGGGVIDRYALEAAGADEKEARTRVAGLSGLEHAVLGIVGCAAAIAILASGRTTPSPGFTLPWAIIPVPCMVIGFWAAERYWPRFYRQPGRRGTLGILLRSVHLIRELFVHPWPWGAAVIGMVLFWAGDAFAVWAGLAAFGFQMNGAALIVGFATGMLFTRRTGPMAGAGVLALVLPWSLWQSGAPLPVAVAGVFVYRILVLWLPMPLSLAMVPTLRTMLERRLALANGDREDRGIAPGRPRRNPSARERVDPGVEAS